MSYLDKLRPGMRENAFYVKNNVRNSYQKRREWAESGEIYVLKWDPQKQEEIGELVDSAAYYNRRR